MLKGLLEDEFVERRIGGWSYWNGGLDDKTVEKE
jgi:hypothetical protein